ncbi:MAG: hypothetical protein JNM84_19310 [Planctomycetes bacterium]|nr:hypothetical protein [Planctomycetota bacterium]
MNDARGSAFLARVVRASILEHHRRHTRASGAALASPEGWAQRMRGLALVVSRSRIASAHPLENDARRDNRESTMQVLLEPAPRPF